MWNEISCTKLQLPPGPLTRGLPPPDPWSLCPLSSTEFVEPPSNKIPGYATRAVSENSEKEDSCNSERRWLYNTVYMKLPHPCTGCTAQSGTRSENTETCSQPHCCAATNNAVCRAVLSSVSATVMQTCTL